MNRFQKKCLIASGATHGLLLSILVIGPAFLAVHNPADDLPPLEMMPDFLTDTPFQGGGGNPAVQAVAPPPPAPAPIAQPPARRAEVAPPEPEPVKPEPPQVKPEPRPETKPPKPEKDPDVIPDKIVNSPKPNKPKPEKAVTPPKPKPEPKRPVVVNLNPTQRTNPKAEKEAQALALAEAQAARAAHAERVRITGERRDLIKSTVRSLAGNLSSTSMSVEMPGPGGESYANYRQFVRSVFINAWIAPEDVSDEGATVTARIVISRDGTIKRTEILSRSGIPALDKSVQNTLNRVRSIGHPFPEGAKENEREFRLNFNLKSKRSAG